MGKNSNKRVAYAISVLPFVINRETMEYDDTEWSRLLKERFPLATRMLIAGAKAAAVRHHGKVNRRTPKKSSTYRVNKTSPYDCSNVNKVIEVIRAVTGFESKSNFDDAIYFDLDLSKYTKYPSKQDKKIIEVLKGGGVTEGGFLVRTLDEVISKLDTKSVKRLPVTLQFLIISGHLSIYKIKGREMITISRDDRKVKPLSTSMANKKTSKKKEKRPIQVNPINQVVNECKVFKDKMNKMLEGTGLSFDFLIKG